MKKIILMSLIASTMFFNAGCDSGDVAAGVIGVGIGLGIGAAAGGYDNGYHDGYHDGRRDDWHGGWGYGPPPRYHGCDRYRCYDAVVKIDGADQLVADNAVDPQVAAFAQKYNVSNEASAKINDAFTNVQTQGLNSFASIGLNSSDLNAIAQRSLPSTDAIKTMAQKLDMSEAQSKDLLQSMITEFGQQAANVQSTYWKSCMAKGSWKTPQNLYCTSTAWNGCSPETGATLCY